MHEDRSLPVSPSTPDSLRLQILATEHWGHLSARSMTWNEMFTRASMFFTVLSAAVVALALVAQATDFGPNFRLFALLLLPVVVVMGWLTYLRLTIASQFDILQIAGMNRIRHAYLEIAPDLASTLSGSPYDDDKGVLQSSGVQEAHPRYLLSSTPFLVGIVDALVAGVLVGLIGDAVGLSGNACVVVGIVAAVASIGGIVFWTYRDFERFISGHRAIHPTPADFVPPGSNARV